MIENESGREVFRYRRGDDVRIYSLRVAAGATELWTVTVRPGQPDSAIKEEDFKSADVAARYFQEIERTLTAGGWREISRLRL
jgi:hypothetical protein